MIDILRGHCQNVHTLMLAVYSYSRYFYVFGASWQVMVNQNHLCTNEHFDEVLMELILFFKKPSEPEICTM